MVEVLVSLVIFAFGLLGAAGLQLSTLRSNQYSASAAVATSLAREYGEIMQSLPSAVVSTSSGASSLFISDTSTYTSGTNAFACKGSGATCDSAALVDSLKKDWALRVAAALPGGKATVCRDSEPRDSTGTLKLWSDGCDGDGDLVVVKVGWTGKDNVIDANNERPKLVISLMGNLQDFVTP